MSDIKKIVMVLGVLLGAYLFFSRNSLTQNHASKLNVGEQIYTCSMHPQIQMKEMGKCPICFMDLIPLVSDSGKERSALAMGKSFAQDAGLRFSPVLYQDDWKETRLYGKTAINPSARHQFSAWFGGRIEKLYFSSRGEFVSAGDLLYEIYSPEAIAYQNEFLQTAKSALISNPLSETLSSAKAKLLYLGFTSEMTENILKTGKVLDKIPVYSPFSGHIVHTALTVGQYVTTGQPLFELADLRTLWVEVSVYESQISALSRMEIAHLVFHANPQKEVFLKLKRFDPFVESSSRTTRAIFELENSALEFFDGNYLDISVRSRSHKGLMVPHSSVMFLGKTGVVFKKEKNEIRSVLVRILEKTQGFYRVFGDISPGDEVVSEGVFKVDSEFQIQAKDSMMSLNDLKSAFGTMADVRTPLEKASERLSSLDRTEFRQNFLTLLDLYMNLSDSLCEDYLDQALMDSRQFLEKLESFIPLSVVFSDFHHDIHKDLDSVILIHDLRFWFEKVSKWMEILTRKWKTEEDMVFRVWCPMAFENRGAFWLQRNEEIRNPYFGQEMISCGEIKSWEEK